MLTWREASPRLSEMLIKDTDAGVRQQAAISLSYIMDQAAGPALIKALKDSSPAVCYAALHTLAVMKHVPAEDAMISLLASADANMRRGAISALGLLQSKKAAGALSAAMKDPDQYARLEAVKALGSIGDTSSAPEIIKLLGKDEQPQVRIEAALSLAKMGMNDGLQTAYEFVKSPELSLRSPALNVIAAVGDARSLQFIEEIYAAEKDPANKSMLDFTRLRLASKLTNQ
jgi:HEAT repeat protein